MNTFLQEKAFAKVNLFLEAVGRRADGYHELDTVMHEISLADEVELRPLKEGLILECDLPELDNGESNLAIRAVRAVERYTGRPLPCHIRVRKRIPLGGGLGGGSSDAAAVIRLLNRVYNLNLDVTVQEAIGATFGSDISFFIRGGTSLCTGRGELITPLKPPPSFSFLLILPGLHVPTPLIFKNLVLTDEKRTSLELRRVLGQGDTSLIRTHLFNRLENPARRLFPELDTWLRKLASERGIMSGSGSSMFVLCDDDQAAQRVRAKLATTGNSHVLITSSARR